MKKNIFIYLVVLLLSTLLLTGCTKKDAQEDPVVTEQEEEVEQEDEEIETEEEEDSQESVSLEGFTKLKQILGEASDFEYKVENITGESKDAYYELKFTLSSIQEGAVTPLFTVEPILSKGVYRVSLTNIFHDTNVITHSKGISMNKGAITGLTRIVTDSDTTRAYDIGILGSNTFKLEMSDSSSGSWTFSVKVSYDTKYSPPTIDYGSTEFSSSDQEIVGMSASDGAKITDYSYLYSSGVVKFSIEVASGASNPIPSVTAGYDSEGVLVVTFPSLSQDKVSTWDSTISLPAGVSVAISRSGESSVYRFSGISNKKPFKLSATQSPNLVLIEIDV